MIDSASAVPMMRPSMRPLRRQAGTTLTGFIIGLVVGLAIAVVVALAITKGSTPFTDKSGKLSKAPEPTAGQVSDPNKPLYGNKDAAREANKEFQKDAKADAADPIGKVIAALPKDAPAKPAAAPATPAAAPAAAPTPAAAAPAAAAPAKADAGEDKFVYYLQAGAFRDTADAENARAKLALLGFEASVSDRSNDSGVLHRVRLGPYNQVDAMNKVRAKLSENGVDVAVVRNQK